jgi:hypothetical protein
MAGHVTPDSSAMTGPVIEGHVVSYSADPSRDEEVVTTKKEKNQGPPLHTPRGRSRASEAICTSLRTLWALL